MPKTAPPPDTKPLSELRSNLDHLLDRIHRERRPVVLTEDGQSALVLLDPAAYGEMVEEIEFLRDVRRAEDEIDRGEGVPHDEVRRRMAARFGG